MDIQQLYEMQSVLDDKIEKQHGLKKQDLVEEKILALLVELGELANETRCFKFWSVKPASERHVILEEYVDGVHFLLSIGLTLGYTTSIPRGLAVETGSLTDQFITIYGLISRFKEEKTEEDYLLLFDTYVMLGEKLEFTWEEIEQAYFAKNKVNHERQQEGY